MAEAAQREITYVGAIAEAARTILNEQEGAFIAGEDVAGAGGCVRLVPGSSRRVRLGAHRGHADLGGRHRRPRGRCRGDRAATDHRHHVHGFHGRMHGRDRQPDGQDALHVRRLREVADHGRDDVRRRHEHGGAAFAEPGGVALPPAGAQGGDTGDALRRQGFADRGCPATTTPSSW